MRFVPFVLILISFGAPSAHAELIEFIQTGRANGTIDHVPFADTEFTITSVGDTDHRETDGVALWIEHDWSEIDISGVGTFIFLVPTRTCVADFISLVTFSQGTATGADLFHMFTNPALGSWDMRISIGPVTGTGTAMQWHAANMTTDGGELMLDAVSGPASFQAIVPEPSTLALGLLGVLGVVTLIYKRQR
jgi:hypothetical protein